MTTSRRSRSRTKTDILLSDIKYSSTCIELDLPFALCCDPCQNIKEAEVGLIKKSSHPSKRFRETSERRRCKQPWASENGESNKHISTNR